MESITKEFIDYLLYIGILDEANIDFPIQEKKENLQNVFISKLTSLLFSLSKEKAQTLSKRIVLRYNENKKQTATKLIVDTLNKNVQVVEEKIMKAIKTLNIYNFSQISSNIKDTSYITNSTNNNQIKTLNNFIQRQKDYNALKIRNKMKLVNEKENLNCELCPFTPKLYTKKSSANHTIDSDNSSAFKRLYDDSSRRTKEQSARRKKNQEDIKKLSSWKSSNKYKSRGVIGLQPGEKLYNDYKIMKNKKAELQKEVDLERGMSFKPALLSDFRRVLPDDEE